MLSADPVSRSRALRPGVSEAFPYPTRFSRGEPAIAYFDTGPRDAPALLFLHGLAGNFTNFEHIAPPFAPAYRVLGLDLPGCGDSAKPDIAYSVRLYVEATIRLLDELGIERAAVVGHSLGGLVASRLAIEHPARTGALVLIDSAGFIRYPTPYRLAARLLFRRWIVTPAIERLALSLLGITFHERNALVRRFIGQAEGRSPHPTVDEFGMIAETLLPDIVRTHLLDDLHRIRRPTLMIWGAKDRLLPVHVARRCAPRLPDGRLVILPGCGHMPIIERPQAVVGELQGFFATAWPARRAAASAAG